MLERSVRARRLFKYYREAPNTPNNVLPLSYAKTVAREVLKRIGIVGKIISDNQTVVYYWFGVWVSNFKHTPKEKVCEVWTGDNPLFIQ